MFFIRAKDDQFGFGKILRDRVPVQGSRNARQAHRGSSGPSEGCLGMTRKELIHLAKRELLDGAMFIDVIERLQEKGCSSREAEELTELANEKLGEQRAL